MVEISSIEQMVEGRPSAGLQLKEGFRAAAETREINPSSKPLLRLLPYVRAHAFDAFFSVFFLISASASLRSDAYAHHGDQHQAHDRARDQSRPFEKLFHDRSTRC